MPEQPLHVGVLLGRQRHELGEVAALLHALQPGRQLRAAVHRGRACWPPAARAALRGSSASTLASSRPKRPPRPRTAPRRHRRARPAPCGSACGSARCHAWSGSPACRRTRTARRLRAHAGDAVARGLRLARRDADLLPDERIEQGALADVRAARRWRPGRSAAAWSGRWSRPSLRTAAGRPAGRSRLQRVEHAARRFLLGRAARAALALLGQPERRARAHSTSKVCACAWPARGDDAVGRHRQLARLQPLLQLGLRRPCSSGRPRWWRSPRRTGAAPSLRTARSRRR